MNLDTQGYVANTVYDNIRGLNGYNSYNDLETHSYEQTQAVKDQATLINMYSDNKAERRNDRIDSKICEVEKEAMTQTSVLMKEFSNAEKENMAQTTAVLQKLSECCCENKVAITALNGKVDLNAEKTTNAILLSEMRTNSKLDAMETARVRDLLSDANRRYDVEREDNNFNKRCIFPVGGSCSK